MQTTERYNPHAMAANSSYIVKSQAIGGFICTVSGTLTVTETSVAATVLVNAVPVTAGTFLRLPIYLGKDGATVSLAGGAAGTLCV